MVANTIGKTIQCRAAVIRSWGGEFNIEQINVEPPQAGEVRIKIVYSSLCHSDLGHWKHPTFFKLPIVFGHEGSGIVESVGEGVTEIRPGDHVMTVFQGECKKCKLCKLKKTNLCETSTATAFANFMPADNKTRFYTLDGSPIHHYLNCSTFTEYTVMTEASVSKVGPNIHLEKACLLSCGVATGLGSALNIAKVESGSTVAVIGLGTVGLAVIEGSKLAGASRIIAIDVDPRKFEAAKKFGATDCLNPKDYNSPLDKVVKDLINVQSFNGGVDYSFECVGKPELMLDALKCCARYGTSVIVGVAKPDATITFPPVMMLGGLQLKSGFYGGYKGKSDTQKLIDMCINKEINVDAYITHRIPLSKIQEGIELLSTGTCIKCVLFMNED